MVVQYKAEITGASTAAIGAQLWIVNNSMSSVNLNDLTVRYYLTNEVAAALQKTINWANIALVGGPQSNFPQGDISITVVPMAMPVASADTYIEFGFTGGNDILMPGQRVQFSWTVQNFMSQKFIQTGDYSFSAAANQMDWPNAVLVYKGQSVVWGNPP